MSHEEEWARYVEGLSRDVATDVARKLIELRHRRAMHFNCEVAEYIIFIDSKGKDVLPMPNVSGIGF